MFAFAAFCFVKGIIEWKRQHFQSGSDFLCVTHSRTCPCQTASPLNEYAQTVSQLFSFVVGVVVFFFKYNVANCLLFSNDIFFPFVLKHPKMLPKPWLIRKVVLYSNWFQGNTKCQRGATCLKDKLCVSGRSSISPGLLEVTESSPQIICEPFIFQDSVVKMRLKCF